jgi:PAS domain S-box-containing protein
MPHDTHASDVAPDIPSDDPVALKKRIAELEARCTAHRDAEEMLRITLSSISDPVFITDAMGRFTFVCPNVEVALGYSEADLFAFGSVDAVLGPPRFDPAELEQAGELQNIEYEVTDDRGRLHDLLVNVKRISIGNGAVLYTCRDVTAHNAAGERIRRLNEQLTHVQRVAMLGEITAGLAHELNQPLATITNLSAGLRRTLHAEATRSAALIDAASMINDEARRAGAMIRRLRDLACRQEHVRKPVRLGSVIDEIRALLDHETGRHGITLHCDGDALLPPMLANVPQLQQVILNLVRNSCEALTESAAPSPRIVLRTSATPNGFVQCSVRDNGPGIDDDHGEHIFEAFHTTKPHGMGMGLAICRSIIEEHGGRLWVEQAADAGAVFHFTIPVFEEIDDDG